jgi:hypothetical protein
MQPAVAPVGLDYVDGAAQKAGIEVDLLICTSRKRDATLVDYFSKHNRTIGCLFAMLMTASGRAASGLFRGWPNR